MRTTDLIRSVLDLIDAIEHQDTGVDADTCTDTISNVSTDSDARRFKHIFDLLSKEKNIGFSNEPDETYANIDSVTTDAGGGINGPSHPMDIRVKDQGMYQ